MALSIVIRIYSASLSLGILIGGLQLFGRNSSGRIKEAVDAIVTHLSFAFALR